MQTVSILIQNFTTWIVQNTRASTAEENHLLGSPKLSYQSQPSRHPPAASLLLSFWSGHRTKPPGASPSFPYGSVPGGDMPLCHRHHLVLQTGWRGFSRSEASSPQPDPSEGQVLGPPNTAFFLLHQSLRHFNQAAHSNIHILFCSDNIA